MARPSAAARFAGLITATEARQAIGVGEHTFRARLATGLYPPATRTEGENRYFDRSWLRKAQAVEARINRRVPPPERATVERPA